MKCPRCGKDNPAEVHTCTPLALKLADELETCWGNDGMEAKAAAELRRLYEENVRLQQALKMEHLNYAGCMEDLKEAEKALTPGEPAAWMFEQQAARSSSGIGGWDKKVLFCKPAEDPFVPKRNITPLYAAPQPQQWVGLTETDLANCDTTEYETARHWERLLREKNGGGV
jgi:hypothetical protein